MDNCLHLKAVAVSVFRVVQKNLLIQSFYSTYLLASQFLGILCNSENICKLHVLHACNVKAVLIIVKFVDLPQRKSGPLDLSPNYL